MNVISIGGASRSGSTLLSMLLGEIDGVVAVGELRYVWSRGFLQNRLCGCGSPFRECGFWLAVVEETYGSFDRVPVQELKRLHFSTTEIWNLPELLSPIRRPAFQERLQDLATHLSLLCSAIQRVSGADTIIDSSKLPSYCYVLSRMPDVNFRLLHMVRDSRAVAYSFMRKKRKPDIYWTEAYMLRFSPMQSAIDWDLLNVAAEMLRIGRVPYGFLRYEDLVRHPRESIKEALPWLPEQATAFLDDDKLKLGTNHTVAGNPIRMSKGGLEIRPDIEWRDRMAKNHRMLVTAATWPLLLRYGYPMAG